MDPISFRPFVPPVGEPIFALKSVAFEILNILTVGVYGAAETMSKQFRIKELKLVRGDLKNQATGLIANWNDLEKQLTSLLDELRNGNEDDGDMKRDFRRLVAQKHDLSEDSIQVKLDFSTTFSEAALGTIFFFGNLIANIMTFGLYGVYQNYVLKNRITYLDAKNQHIQTNFDFQKREKFENLLKIINAFTEFSEIKEENGNLQQRLQGIMDMPEGQAAVEALNAKSDLADLQKKHDILQNDLSALKVQNVVIEKDKKSAETELAKKKQKVQNLNARVLDLNDQEFLIRQERDQLLFENAQKNNELAKERDQKKKDLANLQVQLNTVNAKADKVQNLQKEIDRLNANNKLQPDAAQLHAQLGPIAPKYTPSAQAGEMNGAMDLKNIKSTLTKQQIQYYEAYNTRYGDKSDANAIVKASFQHAFDTLIEMGKKGDKIKLNDSNATPYTDGAYAVYRYMILDLLKGGKVVSNGCHGFKLSINDDVHMLPSKPEWVMQFKKDVNGELKPGVRFVYNQHDDFTPDEDTFEKRDGVDAVSAKWILEQLSEKEKEYLFAHLMSSVIENNHSDFQEMLAFMRNTHDPRVKLVMTASELIQDMGIALQEKFGKTTLAGSWIDNAIGDDEPFVKAEDMAPDLSKIKDDGILKTKGEKFVDWELDIDILSDKRSNLPRQSGFYDMMMMAQLKYRTFFENISQEMMRNPETTQGSINKVTWAMVEKQYRYCHQMVGADPFGMGGQRCLFSNLLAVLMTDSSELTVDNIYKLKNAMAAYLDKLQKAKNQWAVEKVKPAQSQSKDATKLKELAELAQVFETGIKTAHHCSVASYQAWLRGDIFNAASIDLSNLTPFEIQLAAYTLGVRIGVLPINLGSPAIVDKVGRILPEGDFYGPNTKEFFLMGVIDPNGKGGTFYGLYPKLKKLDEDELGEDAFSDLLELEKYWNGIDQNLIKT